MELLRVRLVVEDFPAALRFYATLMDGACVTTARDIEITCPQVPSWGRPTVSELMG